MTQSYGSKAIFSHDRQAAEIFFLILNFSGLGNKSVFYFPPSVSMKVTYDKGKICESGIRKTLN